MFFRRLRTSRKNLSTGFSRGGGRLWTGRWEPDEGQFAGVEQPPLVGRGPVGHEKCPAFKAVLNLADEPPEALAVELGQESGEALAREGAERQVEIRAFVADLDRGDGSVARRGPLVAQLGARSRSQLVVEQHGIAGEVGSGLAEVFLKRSTAPGFWRTLTGLPLLRLIFKRLHRSLMPPMAYSTTRLPDR